MPSVIEAIIFDLDDTLLDWSTAEVDWATFTRPKVDNVYRHLEQAGYQLPERNHFFACMQKHVQGVWDDARETLGAAYFGDALHRTFVECGVPADEVDLDEAMRIYDWQPMPGVALYPDALDTLDLLQAAGYKLGLITNSFFPMWMRDVELRSYNLLDYFDARITSGDTGYIKPHPAIYRHMLALLDTPANRAVFVGDRPEYDIVGANDAGLISVLIDPPHLERDLKGVQPDYTITALKELAPILEQLESAGSQDKVEESKR